MQASVCAQILPITAQNAANKTIAEKTITPVTYRGQTFLMQRTPADMLIGPAPDRLERLEIQLAFCCTILLTDTLNPTCPPERETTIRALIKYVYLARPNWNPKVYHQELKFYLAEDKRRRQVYDY